MGFSQRIENRMPPTSEIAASHSMMRIDRGNVWKPRTRKAVTASVAIVVALTIAVRSFAPV